MDAAIKLEKRLLKLENKLLKVIKPNLEKTIRKKTKGFFFMLPLVITFIGFIFVFIYMFSLEKYNKLENLMNDIKDADKRRFDAMRLIYVLNKDAVMRITEKLIETGNLDGYEIIGDVGVAKTELDATETDFIVAPPAATHVTQVIVQQPRQTSCPNCGAPITQNSGKFCSHCGTKL